MHLVVRHLIDALLGAGDSDSVTRQLRLSIARNRSAQPVPARRTRGEILSMLQGRSTSDAVIRDIGMRKRHR